MEEESTTATSKDSKKKGFGPKKKPGKASAQRRQDDYRKARNAEESAKHTRALKERLGILDDEGPSPLEAAVRSKAKEISTVAVPLSVTTRGVGFASALSFDPPAGHLV